MSEYGVENFTGARSRSFRFTGETLPWRTETVETQRRPPQVPVPDKVGLSTPDVAFLGDVSGIQPTTEAYSDVDLYKYLKRLFLTFMDESKIKFIINKKTMFEWRKCFTHKTFDPNINMNYETHESVGDKVLSYCFKTFLYKRYPNITASQLNNLDQYYMSTHLQALLSSSMGLTNWLRVKGNVPRNSEKIQEDVLEAFFGTIDTIFMKNPNFGMGFGARVCMRFVERAFDIDMDLSVEPGKTYVKQTFVELGSKDGINEIVRQNESTNMWEVAITINQEGASTLARNGIRIDPRRQYRFTSAKFTRKPAEQEAYGKTMNFLRQIGVTREWKNGIKRKTFIENKLGQNYDLMMRKASETINGIDSIDVLEVYNSKPAASVYQIIATDKGKRKFVLETLTTDVKDKDEAFTEIVARYLER